MYVFSRYRIYLGRVRLVLPLSPVVVVEVFDTKGGGPGG